MTSLVLSAALVVAAVGSTAAAPPATQPAAPTVESACPGLASGALAFARLADLPDGTLVRSGGVTITRAEAARETAATPEEVREQLERQPFYVVERMAERRLLLVEATAARAKDQPAASDFALIDALLQPVVGKVKVGEAEIKDFYERNAETFDGAPLEDAKAYVEFVLREEKEQAAIREYVRLLGRRMTIEVSAAWARSQVKAARENPLDEARWNGKRPTLVAFGAAPCACRPDLTLPLMAAVTERLKDRASVVHVDGRQEFILAERYGIASFPTFVVFDARGAEVARRSGAMSEDDLMALVPEAK